MSWRVPQFNPYLGSEEAEAASNCLRSGWITEGKLSQRFVERVKNIAGVKYGVLAPNGTLALYLALKACGIQPGQSVVVPDLTFIATATAVIMAGGRPVFVDVDEFGQLTMDAIEQAEMSRKGLHLPVHLYGAASSAVESPLCIEDACQALGVELDGRPCGSLGLASAFSFFADKTITTGEGGFVGTNDIDVYKKLLHLRNQGRVDRGSFIHPEIGQNFRMTDIQSAIGLAQLDKMPKMVELKQAIHASYEEQLYGIVRVLQPPPGSTHIPFRTVVFFETEADKAMDFLASRGIEGRSAFYPLHAQPCFGKSRYQDDDFPNANRFWNHAICLPTWPGLEQWQIDLVCDTIKEYVG